VPTETDLLRGCKRHHPPSQEGLYRLHHAFAMSVCLRYLPHREDAAEACHDAFVKAFRSLDGFDEARPFRPWFRRILVRTAIDHLRASRRWREAIETNAEPPERVVAPEQATALQAADLLRLLDGLPPVQRAVFNLAEVEGFSHDEIGALLGLRTATSRAHLSRARRRLAALVHRHALDT
jgi:RNA polymerase sigma-70 factor (ECF subfamily)